MSESEAASSSRCDGSYVCNFPDPAAFRWLDRWRCERCGTVYVHRRRRKQRPWRNWFAPDGDWELPLIPGGFRVKPRPEVGPM